jgi:EAL domain-containing protein (putative c-di-GMP-specific phosphodiesterase class I)
VHIYQIDDRELAQQRGEMQWVSRIPKALEENRFRLYYQKIVPIARTDTKSEHWEVLLRLEDETGNIMSPMAFIPAAERYNLMHLIDRWVISTLFTHIGSQLSTSGQQYQENSDCFPTQNRPGMYAVNLSGASINDEQFINFVQEQFDKACLPPSIICFEITETVAITNLAKAAEFILKLKALGCHFALDDFGSGMSSFAYLKNLPVDYLKIDGAFIKDIVTDAMPSAVREATIAAEMVKTIARIASVMGIQTIAEFVENDAILMKLKALGVDYAQGYGIAKPCPFDINEISLKQPNQLVYYS